MKSMMSQHWKCRLWKTLWGLGVLSLVFAWVATRTGFVFGLDAQHWFWDALIFTVLAIPIKLDCHTCDVCMPAGSQ